MKLHPEARELNRIIKKKSKIVYSFLSKRGKSIYFPKQGIISQSAEAKGKRFNATSGIAVEDDESPMRLKSIEQEINLDPRAVFPYASTYGLSELRHTWKKMLYQKNPSLHTKEVSVPVISSAVTHGLSIVGYLFIDKNDSIIIPDLYWENYNLIFENTYEAHVATFHLFKDDHLNLQALRQKLEEDTSKKKILLLNFPHNPTGYTPTIKEVKEIITIIQDVAEHGHELLVIIDDAYFGLVYESGIEQQSIFSYLADIHENVLAVKVDGATKEDYVWGLRIGFITFGIKNGSQALYEALEAKTSGAVRSTISNASHLSQSLVLKAFQSSTYLQEKKEKYTILKSRYEQVKKTLEEHEEYKEFFSALPFNSGYFMCIELKKSDGDKIRKFFLEKYSTGVISFGNILRIAYSAIVTTNIAQLFENIYNACKNYNDSIKSN